MPILSKKSLYKKSLPLIIVFIAVVFSWIPSIDQLATNQIDQGLQRALVSFASARALNAAISVVQGTEASIEPAGVGVTFTPGEILDPANDLVEKFSDLMLVASVSFGVQKILISMGAFWLVSASLSLAALLWARLIFLDLRVSPWLNKLLIILIAIRFALPVITLGSDLAFEKFLANEYQTSQQYIDSSSEEIEDFSQSSTDATEQTGIVERLRNWSQSISFQSPIEELKSSADGAIEHVINLMVIFLLQTLLLPLLILWAIYLFVKRLLQGSPPIKRPTAVTE